MGRGGKSYMFERKVIQKDLVGRLRII